MAPPLPEFRQLCGHAGARQLHHRNGSAMRPSWRISIWCALVAATTLAAPSAVSHPHIFAEARLDIQVDDRAQVRSLRHVWRFDDLFSSTVLLEFDADRDLELSKEELETVAGVVYDSLAEFDYFQFVTADGKSVAMKAPERLIADFQDSQLLILFESEPAEPLALGGTVEFGVYDPTFYTAIDFTSDEYMTVEGLPADCRSAVVRPDPEQAIAENQDRLTEAFFNDPEGNDLSRIFATRLKVTCGARG
jgi:ABC-type uncharacterized transport system substrate-binding protein